MKWIFKLINLYLYSSLHIALGALGLSILSFQAFGIEIHYPYLWFAFLSTAFLYCLHRFIGIQKLKGIENKGRFKVIGEYRNHILVYAFISAIGSLYFFFLLSFKTWLILLIPVIISLLYALPVLTRGQRLRDLAYIKIFLIAIIWAWVTIIVPFSYSKHPLWLVLILFVERALFVFAITLPFDVRDQQIDKNNEVPTLIHKLGEKQSYRLAFACLFLSTILLCLLYLGGQISLIYLSSLLASYLITYIIIKVSIGKSHDYYYTGLIDGTMILPYGFFYLLSILS